MPNTPVRAAAEGLAEKKSRNVGSESPLVSNQERQHANGIASPREALSQEEETQMNAHANAASLQSNAEPLLTRPISTVESIGVALDAALRREDDLMAKETAARGSLNEFAFEHAAQHETDRVYALRALVSLVRAETLTEAAVQLAEAINIVDILWDQFPEESETYKIKADFRALTRLLHSAMDAVNSRAERRLSDFLPSSFTNPHMSPWLDPEQKLDKTEPPGVEPSVERVKRLAFDLSDAMNAYMDGDWRAEIYPSQRHDDPVTFINMEARRNVSPALKAMIEEHRRAEKNFDWATTLTDTVRDDYVDRPENEKIYEAASEAERAALFAVLEYPARSEADLACKAEYVMTTGSYSAGFTGEELDAFLNAMM